MSEKLKILQMIEEGKIKAEEASKLIESIDKSEKIQVLNNGGDAQWIRIRVREGNHNKVNVNIPIALVYVGFNISRKFNSELGDAMDTIDLDEIIELVKNGARGKIMEIEDDDTTVEVVVE